jgi:hypothetical protein
MEGYGSCNSLFILVIFTPFIAFDYHVIGKEKTNKQSNHNKLTCFSSIIISFQ